MDVVKKRRKRGEGTVSNLNKKLRAEGKSYENNRGRIVPEKQPPPVEVSCRCRYQCKDITFEQKTSIFNQFYELGDNVKQNSYLMGNLSICNVKRRRHGSYDDPAQSRRQTTVFFTVPDGKGNHLQVCKETFKEIHGITRRRVETLVKAKKNGDVTYIERRGNKIKERKYNSDDIGRIVSHIERFPKEESHYTRSKSSLMYLSQDLNYRRMYDAFIELHPENKVDFNYYKKIIKEKFANMRFQRPRKDTCNTCDLLKSKIMNDSRNKIDHKNKLEFHHRKAERARENMKTDHEESTAVTSDTCTISVDLQQVFSLPTLTHSQVYYLRQLSCYNLGLHVGDNDQGFMFVWHEGMSSRGGNEIASCILRGVKSKITSKRKLIIWTDNCCGQNKNKMILFLWIYLVCNDYFDEINHKYVVSGHSYLSCDRDFGIIEKRKRVERCEVPLDLVRVLCSANRKRPFLTTLMGEEDFFDFAKAAKDYLNTTKLEISKVSWVKITKAKPGIIFTKKTFSEFESWEQTTVIKKGMTTERLKGLELPWLEMEGRLKTEKKEDLKKFIPYLKDENKFFYKQLVQ